MMGAIFLQVIINGVLMGGFYSLVGMSLNVIFGVMKIVNFCHGELLMIGMYITFLFTSNLGLDPYLSIPIVIVVLFILGAIIQSTLITPSLLDRSDANLIFLTVGLMMLFQNIAMIAFTANYRSIKTAYSTMSFKILGQVISFPKFISFVILLIVTILLFKFLKSTDIGKKIRATSQNPLGAKLVGININKMYIITYGLGAALAGVAGTLLLPFYFVHPFVGNTFSQRAFVVVVLGGLGSIKGAFYGGIILGLLETLGAFVIGPAFKDSVVFITFIAILVIRQNLKLKTGC